MGEYTMYKRWSKEEDTILESSIKNGNSVSTSAALLNRSIGSTQGRIGKLGLSGYNREKVSQVPGEMWKYIAHFPEYRISNFGRVSRDRYILQQGKNSRGYMGVVLKGKSKEVHRLVAYHFIDDSIDNTIDVNHIDFDTTNNTVLNLEVVSRRDNITHTVKAKRNLNHVPEEALRFMCEQLEAGRLDYSAVVQEANSMFNTTIFHNYITTLLTKDMRQYITKDYVLPELRKANRVTDELVHEICRVLESGKIRTSYVDVLIEAGAYSKVATSYVSKLFDGRKKHITSLYNIENGRITSRWEHLRGSTTIPTGSTLK